jgi:hypothetical protein
MEIGDTVPHFLNLSIFGGKWSVSHLSCFTPWGKRLDGLQSQSEHSGKELKTSSALVGNQTLFIQFVA